MSVKLLLICIFVLVSACNRDGSHKNPPLFDETTPQLPTEEVPEEIPTETEVETEVEVPLPAPEVNQRDFLQISNLLPTMYYVPQEKNVSCKGKYGPNPTVYNGSERTSILNLKNEVIAVVCTRFFRFLLMEGSAILKNNEAINYGGVKDGVKRFYKVTRCKYGEGVRPNLCLLPYHTLATDNKVHKIGEIIYVPKADGLVLPDGTKHEGYFIVRDTGGAFTGIGAQRVDMFTGLDPDYNNLFLNSGFDHRTPIAAYKIVGPSAEIIKERLKLRFKDLY